MFERIGGDKRFLMPNDFHDQQKLLASMSALFPCKQCTKLNTN